MSSEKFCRNDIQINPPDKNNAFIEGIIKEKDSLKENIIAEEIYNLEKIKIKIDSGKYSEIDLNSLAKSYKKLENLGFNKKEIFEKTKIDLKFMILAYGEFGKRNLIEKKSLIDLHFASLNDIKDSIKILFFLINREGKDFFLNNGIEKNYVKNLLYIFPDYKNYYSKEEIKNLAKYFNIEELFQEMEREIEKEKKSKLEKSKLFSKKK